MELNTEFEIIAKAAGGDSAAFTELVKKYQKQIYGLAWNLTGNHADADDLAQETFIKAYNAIAKFRKASEFKTWLYRIMMNSYIDKKRKKTLPAWSRLINGSQEESTQQPEEKVASPADDPELSTNSALIGRHIKRALERLTVRERQAFVLKHYQGFSIREVAQIIETSEGTVKSLLFRSVKKLQEALAFLRPQAGME